MRKLLKNWKRLLTGLGALAAVGAGGVGGVSWYVHAQGAAYVRPGLADLTSAPCAIVLGARAKRSGVPSEVLADRLDQAITLYRTGKVQKLLLSGDHGRKEYDEVNCMRRVVLAGGVSPRDVFCDHAGFDTFDSMFRARDIFGVRRAIVVTQDFHLPRALYIARSLGIEVEGSPCDRRRYAARHWNAVREGAARVKAFLDVAVLNAKPRFLGQQISMDGDGRASWDEDR